jgi:hypothetical protein
MAKRSHLNLEQYGESLPGENRSFGGNELYVDTIPQSAWFTNLRAMMPISQWQKLSAYVRHRNNDTCEICGSKERPEAHERWLFDEKTETQKLMRLMCLCRMCHLSTHFGYAEQIGFLEDVKKHFFAVNGWGDEELKKHLIANKEKITDNSKSIKWKIDVSIVQNVGINIYNEEELKNNIEKKREAIKNAQRNSSIEFENVPLDLSRELRRGHVAIIAEKESDSLGSIPLSRDGIDPVCYIAKPSSEVRKDAKQIPLTLFIKAHNNPITMKSRSHIEESLKNDKTPRRFIIKKTWIDYDLAIDYFKYGIIFSADSKGKYP